MKAGAVGQRAGLRPSLVTFACACAGLSTTITSLCTWMFGAPDRRTEASRYPAVLWRRENAMRHFVRFAKVSASGSVDRVGWRLRIFLTSREAGAFTEELAGK